MRILPALAIAPLALLLTGCAGGGQLTADAARPLQQSVLAVADAAGAQDYAAALQHLAELEQMNDAALQRGEISAARHDAIAASIAAVRSDLAQLQAAAQQAAMQQRLDQLQQQLQQQQQQQQPPKDNGKGNKGKNGKGDEGDGS